MRRPGFNDLKDFQMIDLTGKVAVVTGCGSVGPGWSNGRAIAVVLARQGAIVYGLDRNLDSAIETRDLITKEGGTCYVAPCDVTSPEEVQSSIDDCVRQFSHIDILVNNVGESLPGDPITMDHQTWSKQFDLNVTSAFLTVKHVLPIMLERTSGSIINVSSVAAIRYIGKPQVAYSASKAALIQLSKTTAVIHAASGIRVNCVLPGLMNTPLVARLSEKYAGGKLDEFVEQRNKQVPAGRMGEAWDVAHAVAFLASDEAKYINGTELIVDGAFTAATR